MSIDLSSLKPFKQLENLKKVAEKDLELIHNGKTISPDEIRDYIDDYNTIVKEAVLNPERHRLLWQHEEAAKSVIHKVVLSQMENCDTVFDTINKQSSLQQFENAYKKVSKFIEDFDCITNLDTCRDYFESLRSDCYRLQKKLKSRLVYPRDFGETEVDSSCPYKRLRNRRLT